MMRKILHEDEQLICTTRPQSKSIIWPIVAGILSLGILSFITAWLLRGNLQRLLDWLPEGSELAVLALSVAASLLVLLNFTLRRVLRWAGTRYVITSERVLILSGMVPRIARQYLLNSINDVAVRSGLLQRPLRSGTITLEMRHAGYGVLVDVPEVARFHGFLMKAITDLPAGVIYANEPIENFADPDLPWELRERETR